MNEVNRGRCTLSQIASWTSTAPARIWNIAGKGQIREGYDADLVLLDLNKAQTLLNENQLTKCGWSPWHGEILTGWPIRTWGMGQTVFAEGRVIDDIRGEEIRYQREDRPINQ